MPDASARIEQHVTETRIHADRIEQCLRELGTTPSTAKSTFSSNMGTVESVATGMFTDEQVKNALMDYGAEQFEVACYHALVTAARHLGHERIAELCELNMREDEAAMVTRSHPDRRHEVARHGCLRTTVADCPRRIIGMAHASPRVRGTHFAPAGVEFPKPARYERNMDVGATLRRARLERRLTIDELARATKISATNLQALEANDFERLPAMVYTRGFLRVYAREVGLDPEETTQLYLRSMDEALSVLTLERRAAAIEAAAAAAEGKAARRAAQADREAAERRAAAAARRAAAEARIAAAVERYQQATRSGVSGVASAVQRVSAFGTRVPINIRVDLKSLPRPAQVAAAAVALVLLASALLVRGGNQGAEIASAQAVQASVAATTPAPAALLSDAVPAANVREDGLTIQLKATGPCWVSASADRSPVLSRLLHAGDSETIDARDEFVLRVGDPSTISLTINGDPARPLGRAGMPVTVQINKENYRDYVATN